MTYKTTLLIPCYNAIQYLPQLIQNLHEALLKKVFKVLIIDDGSDDGSWELLQKIAIHEHIELLRNEKNYGLIYTLNRGLDIAETPYIARLDADDLMAIDRIEIQETYLDQHSEVVLCGSWFVSFGNGTDSVMKNPTEAERVQVELLFRCPITVVMMRLEILKKNSLKYSYEYPHAEDYELWSRLIKVGKIVNIPQVLMKRREHPTQVTKKYALDMKHSAMKVYKKLLTELDIDPTEKDLELHYKITREPMNSIEDIHSIDAWLTKLKLSNDKILIYPEPTLTAYLREVWLKHMAGKTKIGKKIYNIFKKSMLSPYKEYTYWQKVKFYIKCLLKV